MSDPLDHPEIKQHLAEGIRAAWLRAWVRDFLIERYQREGEAAFNRFRQEEAAVTFHAASGVGDADKATIKSLMEETIEQARAFIAAGVGPWRKRL